MKLAFYSLLAFTPIITAFLLLVVADLSATQAMAAAYSATVLIALLIWKVPFIHVAASTVEGLVVTLEILYIVFGAILLLNILQESGAIGKIRQGLLGISADRRVQVIIIAWLFGSFIEGASGFGTPAVICVPLLVTIGFPAMAAVMAMLIIQSTASAFGGIGVPIVIGLESGLEDSEAVAQEAARLGVTFADYLADVGAKTGLIQGFIGVFMPLLLVMTITAYFGEHRSWKDGWAAAKFALFAGLAFVIPYSLTALLIGPEFPTLLGGLVGLAIVVPAAKGGFFAPEQQWDFPDPRDWPFAWSGIRDAPSQRPVTMSALYAWTPYVLLSLFLILSRLSFLPFREWLQLAEINFSNIFGTSVSISTKPLYLPGSMFILVVVIACFLYQVKSGQINRAIAGATKSIGATALAIGTSVPMAKVFMNSDVNNSGLASMPLTLADGVSSLAGSIWPFFAPMIGTIGAFVAGSATVSNMMFSSFQFGVAEQIGASPSWILALQVAGAASGNMIAVSNIVAAVATVGLTGQEGIVLRKLLPVIGIILTLTGVIGMVAVFAG